MTDKPYPADLYPGCPCHVCDSPTWPTIQLGAFDVPMARMSLCPTCGNKRCPGAVDHDNPCTGSNAPGQPGSFYAGGIASEPTVCTRCGAAITATMAETTPNPDAHPAHRTFTGDWVWRTITGASECPDGQPHNPQEDTR